MDIAWNSLLSLERLAAQEGPLLTLLTFWASLGSTIDFVLEFVLFAAMHVRAALGQPELSKRGGSHAG